MVPDRHCAAGGDRHDVCRGRSAGTRARLRGGGLHRGMDGGHCPPELDRRGCRQARYRAGDRSGQAQRILVTQWSHPSAPPWIPDITWASLRGQAAPIREPTSFVRRRRQTSAVPPDLGARRADRVVENPEQLATRRWSISALLGLLNVLTGQHRWQLSAISGPFATPFRPESPTEPVYTSTRSEFMWKRT